MPVELEVIFESSPSNSNPIGTVPLAPRSPKRNSVVQDSLTAGRMG